MSKKMKCLYFVFMAITGLIFIVDIVFANWWDAAYMGTTALWLFVTYRLVGTNYDLIADLDTVTKALSESLTRENIATQELSKMRERAQKAEKQLQQILDDTPARGKDGRFVKRDSE